MIKEAIIKLSKKEDLTYDEAEAVMNEIMDGAATPVQMASYLTALSLKGETIDEITASAAGMRAHCIKLLHDMNVLEIVGTGGDGANSFNISTTSSLVIAAGGVPVAKHGNRAASSKSGAADVLEALGVKITIPPEKSAEILKKINICFLFAQNYHIAMKYVAPIRKELGIRTVFNILGPLSNPAGANMELMGVFDQSLVEPLAQVMMKLGVNRGMVVFGQDKLDEISMSAPTSVCEIKDGWFQSYEITPEQFGFLIVLFLAIVCLLVWLCFRFYVGRRKAISARPVLTAVLILCMTVSLTGCGHSNSSEITHDFLADASKGENRAYTVELDMVENTITATSKATGEAILLTRDPFGQSGAISSIYVDEDACYYASSGEVGDGFQIYRIDLKDFSTRLYFSTGSDNTATFWGLFDHEPTVDELLADVGSITSFVVDGNYIYYLQGGRLYKVFRWTGWETVEVTNTAQVQSIKFLDGKIVCEK